MNHGAVRFGHESVRAALTLGATGPTDTVRVRLGCARNIEVDDVRHRFDVNPSRHNVRCHQDVETMRSETLHGTLTRALRHVALEGHGTMTALGELFRKTLRPPLRTRKDDCGKDAILFEHVLQKVELAPFGHGKKRVRDRLCGCRSRQLDDDGIFQDGVGKLANLRRHRGREHQVLAFFGKCPNDSTNIR